MIWYFLLVMWSFFFIYVVLFKNWNIGRKLRVYSFKILNGKFIFRVFLIIRDIKNDISLYLLNLILEFD